MDSACPDSSLKRSARKERQQMKPQGEEIVGSGCGGAEGLTAVGEPWSVFAGSGEDRQERGGCPPHPARSTWFMACPKAPPSIRDLLTGEDRNAGQHRNQQPPNLLTIHSNRPRRLRDPNKRHWVKTRLSREGERRGERFKLNSTREQPLEQVTEDGNEHGPNPIPKPPLLVGPDRPPSIVPRPQESPGTLRRKRLISGSYKSPQGIVEMSSKCDEHKTISKWTALWVPEQQFHL